MNETIKIKKGLDIPLGGTAERTIIDARSIGRYAVRPPDVVGFTPRLLVAEGDSVHAGQPLVADKNDPRLTVPSPVDGTVEAIVRGEKRKLLEVVVSLTPCPSPIGEGSGDSQHSSPLSIRRGVGGEALSPVWWMLRERPFGTIANPDHKPKGIYVSMRDTNPLAPDIDFALRGREHEFEAGIEALKAYAPVHVVRAEGPHPAGNIGTIVATLDPINKGECIWHVGAQDVANIGRWVTTGEYRPERVIAVGGPAAKSPKYYRVVCGASIKQIADVQLMNPEYPALSTFNFPLSTRVISGSVLSGTTVAPDGFLGLYDQQLTFIEEGDHYEFMGWLMPGLKKFSFSKTFLSGFARLLPTAYYPLPTQFNTNMHGSVRPFLFTGSFEKVFPMDIYPLQLIKACIVGDIELQEQLGIYEVEPEDFALCEFIDPSKTDIQTIIREALEVLRKEATA
ncbi:MAG: NADH:ubiquinone reductase (Na(+)-transporting) subunit A [Bacteroidales bacterium]|nr:NADH:ubiquinone reductase (Na(+)-transporting) subunit A [Bacteroidales bacterium]